MRVENGANAQELTGFELFLLGERFGQIFAGGDKAKDRGQNLPIFGSRHQFACVKSGRG